MASKHERTHNLGVTFDARHQQRAGLLLFDLDDTIVQSGTYVSPRVIETLRAAKAAGYTLSIASGRPRCMIHPAILEAKVMDYAVCANGATVVSLATGELVSSTPMSALEAWSCYQLLLDLRPAWNAFFDDNAYFEWKGASYLLTGRTGALARTNRYTKAAKPLVRINRFVRRGMRFVGRIVSNPRQHQVVRLGSYLRAAEGGVEKLGCVLPDAERATSAVGRLRRDGRYEVIRMSDTELEITRAGVTKATGAVALMGALGVDAAGCVAFGDGGNDLPLASVVGRFVAPDNADDEVKAAASEVCPSVVDDGVAVWIERNCLGA